MANWVQWTKNNNNQKDGKFVISHDASEKMPLVGVCHWLCGLKECPLLEDFVLCNGLRPLRASMICPSLEDFVTCNGLWPPKVSMICPSSESFVSCNGFWPPRVSMICPLSESFVSCNGLRPPRFPMICLLSEDFVSCNGLQPPRVPMICPLSEDFVSYNGLQPQGPQWSAPYWRTLSCTNDGLQPRWVTGYKQKQAKGNSGADKASRDVSPWWRWKIFCWLLGQC